MKGRGVLLRSWQLCWVLFSLEVRLHIIHCIFFVSKDWLRVFFTYLTYIYLQRLTTVICKIRLFCIWPLASVILIPMEDIFSRKKHLGVVV